MRGYRENTLHIIMARERIFPLDDLITDGPSVVVARVLNDDVNVSVEFTLLLPVANSPQANG